MNTTYLNHILDHKTPTYGDRDRVDIIPKSKISDGSTSNSNTWNLSVNHIGTHIDVPRHFYENGKTITDVPAEDWLFHKISLVDITCEGPKLISIEDLKNSNIHPETELLLIRTGYESKRMDGDYWQAYPGIASEACEFLRSTFPKLRGVGFDFISLTSPKFKDEGKKAHLALLQETEDKFVLIIEDMKLAHLDANPDQVIISPLLVRDADGSPVTVLALSGTA